MFAVYSKLLISIISSRSTVPVSYSRVDVARVIDRFVPALRFEPPVIVDFHCFFFEFAILLSLITLFNFICSFPHSLCPPFYSLPRSLPPSSYFSKKTDLISMSELRCQYAPSKREHLYRWLHRLAVAAVDVKFYAIQSYEQTFS